MQVKQPFRSSTSTSAVTKTWKSSLDMSLWAKYLPHNDYFGKGQDMVSQPHELFENQSWQTKTRHCIARLNRRQAKIEDWTT